MGNNPVPVARVRVDQTSPRLAAAAPPIRRWSSTPHRMHAPYTIASTPSAPMTQTFDSGPKADVCPVESVVGGAPALRGLGSYEFARRGRASGRTAPRWSVREGAGASSPVLRLGGWITMSDGGEVLWSRHLSANARNLLGLPPGLRLDCLRPEHLPYWHSTVPRCGAAELAARMAPTLRSQMD